MGTSPSEQRDPNEELKRLDEHLAVYNLEVKNVSRDGNCLFRAVADQICGESPSCRRSDEADEVRRRTVLYMTDHREDFEQFVSELDGPWDRYLENMSMCGTWGSQLELTAICKSYRIHMLVFQATTGDSYEMQWDAADEEEPCIMLAYVGGNHYNAVRVSSSKTGRVECQSLRRVRTEIYNSKNLLRLNDEDASCSSSVSTGKAAPPYGRRLLSVLFGPSASGRSTFLERIGAKISVVETDGDSDTCECKVYDTELGLFMDTPGYDQTQLRFTELEVAQMVAKEIKLSKARIVRFLIFESMANDVVKLRQTLCILSLAVGSMPSSAVIVASKMDTMVNAAQRRRRLDLIQGAMGQFNLPVLLAWQNFSLDEAGWERKKKLLGQAWEALPPEAMDVSSLVEPRSRIEVRAARIALAASGKDPDEIEAMFENGQTDLKELHIEKRFTSKAMDEIMAEARALCRSRPGSSCSCQGTCFSFLG